VTGESEREIEARIADEVKEEPEQESEFVAPEDKFNEKEKQMDNLTDDLSNNQDKQKQTPESAENEEEKGDDNNSQSQENENDEGKPESNSKDPEPENSSPKEQAQEQAASAEVAVAQPEPPAQQVLASSPDENSSREQK
jgi:hypothetical protein